MSNLTADRSTKEYLGHSFDGLAGATIYEGGLVAMNSDGEVIPASATASVAGVALNHAAEDAPVKVAFDGIFGFNASTTSAVGAKDIGKQVYVEDDNTVALSVTVASGSTAVPFGKVVGMDGNQVLVKL